MQFFLRFIQGLRFPVIFAVVLVVFCIDLVVPDLLPFADELLLGLMTVLLGAWRKRKNERAESTKLLEAAEEKTED